VTSEALSVLHGLPGAEEVPLLVDFVSAPIGAWLSMPCQVPSPVPFGVPIWRVFNGRARCLSRCKAW
jgi:hypothetical protein